MSDMHISSGDGNGNYSIVYHFPVPDINNEAGISLRKAVENSGLVSTSILLPGNGQNGTISTTEENSLANGSLIEHVTREFIDGPGMTNAARTTLLQKNYPIIKAREIAKLTKKLKFFGNEEAQA